MNNTERVSLETNANKKVSDVGLVGFILSLVNIITGFIPVFGWIICLLGLIFCIVGTVKANKEKSPIALPLVGLVVSVLSVFLVSFYSITCAEMCSSL